MRENIPYFKELGLTYLHLMPLFKAPEGDNDGGYAVSSYREVNPALGTMDELAALAAELRARGHQPGGGLRLQPHLGRARLGAARAGRRPGLPGLTTCIFPDRTMPDAYERNAARDFSRTSNPALHLPARASGTLGLDDLPQLPVGSELRQPGRLPGACRRRCSSWPTRASRCCAWTRWPSSGSRLGTVCENLPEAHLLIQAFNALARIAAPALLFKSEAIVHPDEVAQVHQRRRNASSPTTRC